MELTTSCGATGTKTKTLRDHPIRLAPKTHSRNKRAAGAIVNCPLRLLQRFRVVAAHLNPVIRDHVISSHRLSAANDSLSRTDGPTRPCSPDRRRATTSKSASSPPLRGGESSSRWQLGKIAHRDCSFPALVCDCKLDETCRPAHTGTVKPIPLLLLTLLFCSSDAPSAETHYRITVSAGEWDRTNTVVSFTLPETKRTNTLALLRGNGETVSLQIDPQGRAYFIEKNLKKNSVKTYELKFTTTDGAFILRRSEARRPSSENFDCGSSDPPISSRARGPPAPEHQTNLQTWWVSSSGLHSVRENPHRPLCDQPHASTRYLVSLDEDGVRRTPA